MDAASTVDHEAERRPKLMEALLVHGAHLLDTETKKALRTVN